MKKIFLTVLVSAFVCSCSDDSSNPSIATSKYEGTFKEVNFEYKGKIISVSPCQSQSRIVINNDKSGSYENYEVNSTGVCAAIESLTGTWEVTTDNKLVLSKSGQIVKTLNLDTISGTEIKVVDTSHNVDGIPGNDEAVLSFVKIQ